MHKYAQIDVNTGVCISISQLSGEVEAEHMISIDDQTIEIGDKYIDGIWNRVNTIRIDNETVEDVSYTFDLELGEYVEQSREQRTEPLPPQPESESDKIARLETQLNKKEIEISTLRDEMANQTTAILEIYDMILGG